VHSCEMCMVFAHWCDHLRSDEAFMRLDLQLLREIHAISNCQF
jgi:hypothetical protein